LFLCYSEAATCKHLWAKEKHVFIMN